MVETLQSRWIVTVAPTVEPLTLSDFRSTSAGSYGRIDFTDDDSILTDLIHEGRQLAEQLTSKSLAPQTIQVEYTMPQITNQLSGAALLYEQDYYQYNESLGANPFSPAPFVLSVPFPPLVAVSLFEYRTTVFNAWQTWPASVSGVANYVTDLLPLPGLIYLQYPPPAYQYRITCSVGYTTLPYDLKNALKQLILWMYDNRDGKEIPDGLKSSLMGRKTWVL